MPIKTPSSLFLRLRVPPRRDRLPRRSANLTTPQPNLSPRIPAPGGTQHCCAPCPQSARPVAQGESASPAAFLLGSPSLAAFLLGFPFPNLSSRPESQRRFLARSGGIKGAPSIPARFSYSSSGAPQAGVACGLLCSSRRHNHFCVALLRNLKLLTLNL
jgi:hypothetical protein